MPLRSPPATARGRSTAFRNRCPIAAVKGFAGTSGRGPALEKGPWRHWADQRRVAHLTKQLFLGRRSADRRRALGRRTWWRLDLRHRRRVSRGRRHCRQLPRRNGLNFGCRTCPEIAPNSALAGFPSRIDPRGSAEQRKARREEEKRRRRNSAPIHPARPVRVKSDKKWPRWRPRRSRSEAVHT